MTLSDETLMAYADGEVDEETSARIEAAISTDPAVAARVAQHRDLRRTLAVGFGGELDEPVPERLLAAARGARAGGRPEPQVARPVEWNAMRGRRAGRPRWPAAAALAASVILGVGLGYFAAFDSEPMFASRGGTLAAGAALAKVLSNGLAANRSATDVAQIGLSYRAKSGEYCRTFTLSGAAASGVACRRGGTWQVDWLFQAASTSSGYRTAAAGIPPLILRAVEDQMAGEPLDAAGEIAARQEHWAPIAGPVTKQ